jgi:undecaprenyl-diphosphatase
MTAWSRLAHRLRQREAADIRLLLALVVLLGGLWAFAELADEVLEGDSMGADSWILQALRDPARDHAPIGPSWLAEAARDVTALGGHAVLGMVIAAVSGFLLLQRKPHIAGLVLASGLGGMVVNNLLKVWFNRPRPDLVPHAVQVHSLSFPSGHAMVSAAVYLSLAVVVARILPRPAGKAYVLAVGVVLTFLVGLTRVYLGVHYPTDVLAGWLAGALWALLCGVAGEALQRRGAVEQPGHEPGAPA